MRFYAPMRPLARRSISSNEALLRRGGQADEFTSYVYRHEPLALKRVIGSRTSGSSNSTVLRTSIATAWLSPVLTAREGSEFSTHHHQRLGLVRMPPLGGDEGKVKKIESRQKMRW